MSVEWFELGQRLRASTGERCEPRLLHAPMLLGPRPVAVRAEQHHGVVTVAAASSDGRGEAGGLDGLELLAGLGVSLDESEPATLVSDDPATLRNLLALARTVAPGSGADAVAGHIGWWAERADFPGGSAVADVVEGCRARWVTGRAPSAEPEPGLWRDWLGVRDASVAGVLALHGLVTEGEPLPWLDALADDDRYTFGQARKSHSDGWDWRRPDTTSRAAVGLRTRCDAADLYAGALLSDPLWRARGVHTGEVVVGEVCGDPPAGQRVVAVACGRLDARVRAGADVLWWLGAPTDALPAGGGTTGTVRATAVSGGRLVLSLSTPYNRPALGAGQEVTLMPAAPSVQRQRRGQQAYRSLQYSRRSWLTQGRTPTPTRRTVPLDVLLAGAEND